MNTALARKAARAMTTVLGLSRFDDMSMMRRKHSGPWPKWKTMLERMQKPPVAQPMAAVGLWHAKAANAQKDSDGQGQSEVEQKATPHSEKQDPCRHDRQNANSVIAQTEGKR